MSRTGESGHVGPGLSDNNFDRITVETGHGQEMIDNPLVGLGAVSDLLVQYRDGGIQEVDVSKDPACRDGVVSTEMPGQSFRQLGDLRP